MNCVSCNEVVWKTENFCQSCGYPLSDECTITFAGPAQFRQGPPAEGVTAPLNPQLPTVLLLDTSGGGGLSHESLQTGLRQLLDELRRDKQTTRRLDLCLVTFGGQVVAARDFGPPDADLALPSMGPVRLLGTGARMAFKSIWRRLEEHRSQCRPVYRPWIFLLTGGMPDDMQAGEPRWDQVKRTMAESARRGLPLFPIVAGHHPVGPLADLLGNPLQMRNGAVPELFRWFATTLRTRCQTMPAVDFRFPPPTWAERRED